jgi:CHAT domain-containing protein
LGPVAPIAAAIESWRKSYGLPGADHESDPAAQLRRLVWDKLQPHLGDAKTVLLSPDGATARFPWPALPGKEPGRYLIEEVAIAVVPIPRLLPELLAAPSHRGAGSSNENEAPSLLVVGDVNFDADPGRAPTDALAASAPKSSSSGARGGELWHWPELPGSRTEIVAIADSFDEQFPDARLKKLRKDQATKSRVVGEMEKARFLHFATHGFFAPPALRSALAASNRPAAGDQFSQRDIAGYHPGLLSGLVLAGANQPAADGKDDGILTALEVAQLDLSRVDLATLSACETGLGETAGGEGLLGLQRAFQASGAKSVVATLWTINDDASRSLMIDFYENLWKKKLSKLESLRQAQLTMLRDGVKRGLAFKNDQPPDQGRRLPPYYWAAFVLSGDWR